MPSDRNSRPTDARRSGSSSMTNTVEFASDIAAARKRSRKISLCLCLRPDRAFLVLILEPEQTHFFPGDAHGVHQSLRADPVLGHAGRLQLKFDRRTAS